MDAEAHVTQLMVTLMLRDLIEREQDPGAALTRFGRDLRASISAFVFYSGEPQSNEELRSRMMGVAEDILSRLDSSLNPQHQRPKQ